MATFFQRIMRAIAYRSAKWGGLPLRDPALVKMFGQGEETSSGIDVNEKTAMNVSAVFAAATAIAGSKAQSDVTLYEKRDGQNLPAEAHPVFDLLLHAPNPEMSAFTFHETLQSHALLWGNGFAEIEWGTDDRPFALWPIHPSRVAPGRDTQGRLGYRIAPDVNEGDPEERELADREMLHIRGMSDDGIRGYPVVQCAREALGLSLGTEKCGASLFGRGITPGGVLEHPGELSEEAQNNLRESMESKHRGPDNVHRIMILEEGMKFSPTSIPPEDAQFLETRLFQVVEVARWFNMPPHMLRDLSHATFSNIEHQSLEFLIYTMGPWFKRWVAEYRRKLLRPEERRKYFFKHDAAFILTADVKTRFDAYAQARNTGFYSVNDIREKEGMPRVKSKAADALLMPVNMTVLDDRLIDAPQTNTVESAVISGILQIMTAVAANQLNTVSAAVMLHAVAPQLTTVDIEAMLTPYKKVI